MRAAGGAHRSLVGLRAAMRSTLDPLLPTAARDAIQVIDADRQASGTLKKSVRRLLVDQREFRRFPRQLVGNAAL